ncbi:MAG: hypothetical protein Q7T51_03300 [Candidatus Moranbacteria bacterium]|nr:hypothetical protein [Candidatus Moranbacteria bacterium]
MTKTNFGCINSGHQLVGNLTTETRFRAKTNKEKATMLQEVRDLLRKAKYGGILVRFISGIFKPDSDYRYNKVRAAVKYLSTFEEKDAEYSRAVALILIRRSRVKDHEIIIAALLHRVMKNASTQAIQSLEDEFGYRTARLVKCFSTGKHKNFLCEFLMIKIAGYVYELMTAKTRNPQLVKKARKLIFLAEKHRILIHELEAAIDSCGRGIPVHPPKKTTVLRGKGVEMRVDTSRAISKIRIVDGQSLLLTNAFNGQPVNVAIARDHEIERIDNPQGSEEPWLVISGTQIGNTESSFRKKCLEQGIEMLG